MKLANVLLGSPAWSLAEFLSGFQWPFSAPRLSATHSKACSLSTTADNSTFDWETLTPSTKLDWTQCYGDKQCARFLVPRNYENDDGETFALAVIRIPSVYPQDSPEWRGPIITNPGGPGGSGVGLIRRVGNELSTIVGKEFDIVSFDPRGAAGFTTPRLSFFKIQAEVDKWRLTEPPPVNSTEDALAQHAARIDIIRRLALQPERGGEIASHVSTAATARDLLQLTRAFGREKLQYWGFSYGTVLGASFAIAYPNFVERLVIDGVKFIDGYFEGTWSGDLVDNNKTINYFYTACSLSKTCPLHEKTAELVEARVHKIFESLKNRPLPTIGSENSTFEYEVVTYQTAKNALFFSAYKAFKQYEPLAEALAAAERGDGTKLATFDSTPHFSCGNGACNKPSLFTFVGDPTNEGYGIAGVDSAPFNLTLEQMQAHYENISKEAPLFADIWSVHRFQGSNWGIRPAMKINGPLAANTSFPLLIVSNTMDPVTPLVSGQKSLARFPGSGLLVQNAPGHCSIAATSVCTHKAIRRYFREGVLPDTVAVCEVSDTLWGVNSSMVLGGNVASESKEVGPLFDAIQRLSDGFNPRLYAH